MRTYYLKDNGSSFYTSLYKWRDTQKLYNLQDELLLPQISLEKLQTVYHLTVIDFRVLLIMKRKSWERLPLKEILNDVLKEIS